MYKREVTSSESKYYIGIPGKGMTYSLDLRTKRSNKKQKARFSITDITKQGFREIFKKFENSLYLGYNTKQVHNEPTESYLFLIKNITKLIKNKEHVLLFTKEVKLGINKKIGRVNEAI